MKPLEWPSCFHSWSFSASLDLRLWALEILWSTASPRTFYLLWYEASSGFKSKKNKKINKGQRCVSNLSCESVEVGWCMVPLFLPSCCASGFEILEMCRWDLLDGQAQLGGLQFGEVGGQLVFFVIYRNWILFLSTLRPPSYPATQSSHSISISPWKKWGDIKMWARDGEESEMGKKEGKGMAKDTGSEI